MIIMPSSLKIFSTVVIAFFLLYVLRNVQKKQLSVRNSIIWLLMGVAIIFCLFQMPLLRKIADLIGIETISNLIFFLGFIFLIFVCFDIMKILSTQNKKIINLTQELALLKKEVEKNEKGNH